jgi:outer membrane protein assembly factor BamB
LAVGADGTKRWAVNVGGNAFVTAAPAIGASAIWAGSEDGTLYALALDGSAIKGGVGVNTGGAIKGSVAVVPDAGKEWAFATSSAGFLGVASTVPAEYAIAGPTNLFSAGPVVGSDGRVYAATVSGSLRAYRLTTSPAVAIADAWSAPVSLDGGVTAPMAIDANGSVWTGTTVGTLAMTATSDASGTVTPIGTMSSWIVGSPVVLTNGDIVVGDISGVLRRFSVAGVEIWSAPRNLGSAVEGPVVLAAGDAGLLVPAAGKLFALRSDGADVWSATLDTGSLRPANIFTPPGQTANVMSTAYLASSSGKLFAVIVDGELDASAPWPKAFHDPRNTNRAGPQP